MAETHTIEISKDAKVTITVEGVKGSACTAATERIARALGTTVSDTPTPEMYEHDNVQAVNRS